MKYHELIKNAINTHCFSLNKISILLRENGVKADKAYISRLQNGKIPPANDEINDALASVLKIDPVELKAAAYREKIPLDVLKELQKDPKLQTAWKGGDS